MRALNSECTPCCAACLLGQRQWLFVTMPESRPINQPLFYVACPARAAPGCGHALETNPPSEQCHPLLHTNVPSLPHFSPQVRRQVAGMRIMSSTPGERSFVAEAAAAASARALLGPLARDAQVGVLYV